MSARPFQFVRGGIHLPALSLWLDPHEARKGPERVFVSHAHSDHTASHREVVLSEPTSRLMQARLGGRRVEHLLKFGETQRFDGPGESCRITLLPAGHILGSAMSLVEWDGHSLLYTGDFKLRRSLAAELCEPRRADLLIMETTFGLPRYQFPPAATVWPQVIRFCQEALADGVTPVLFGYSLGRSQELLCGLAAAGLQVAMHRTVKAMTEIYEHFGWRFPGCDGDIPPRGKVFVCPTGAKRDELERILGPIRTAVVTGWALDSSCRYRHQCDAAFPISDHADFPELIEMVKQVAPRKVYTLHGFAAEFAMTLRDLGIDAQALGVDEQLSLRLGNTLSQLA